MTGSEPTLREAAQALVSDAWYREGEEVCTMPTRNVIRLRAALERNAAAPETWTCPTCHTPMPADAAVGHLRGEHLPEITPDDAALLDRARRGYHAAHHGPSLDADDCQRTGCLAITALIDKLARRLRADAAASGSGGET